MRRTVKIFKGAFSSEVENDINRYSEEHHMVPISVGYSVSDGLWAEAMVIFEEEEYMA